MLAHVQPPDKTKNVYYAFLYHHHGVLARLDGEYVFMADDGALTVIEPEHFPFITTLGQVGLADTQALRDQMRGGAARIACTRQEGIA